MKKIDGFKLLNWASILDDVTLEQAKLTSTMPFVSPHLALMPDAHLGKGSTVGSVIPTKGAIMPAAIGVDIGCGMMAVKTNYKADVFEKGDINVTELRKSIEARIPLSKGNYVEVISKHAELPISVLELKAERFGFKPEQYSGNWRNQLGTLGSGNHFIEVTKDEENYVWLFLHSGSRGVGNKIAQKHIKIAQRFNKQYFINLPDPDMAYLVENTTPFWDYIQEMQWAQEFAMQNRLVMMKNVVEAFNIHIGNIIVQDTINCHHNFTQQEHHFGKELWITRKGAISAYKGEMGLIPGSMGASSYVVEGLGNVASMFSAPHGAGRQHSRNVSKGLFSMESLEQQMKGIEWSHSSAFLDEHPEAYKPIDVVMEDAKDLVTIKHTLNQIINIKGE